MPINTNTSLFNYNGYITTASGTEVYLPRPTTDMISIDDIARALSNIARWNGQTRQPFTVAQHSVMVCWMAPNELKKAALMHDAAEAYLGDVSRPLKELVPGYKLLEEKFQQVIALKYGYPTRDVDAIKEFDKAMQKVEWEYLYEHNPISLLEMYINQKQLGLPEVWNHHQAQVMFLMEFKKWFTQF